MNHSLRSRLLLGIAATTLIGLAVTAAVMYLAIRGTLFREFDELLAAKARVLVTLVEQQDDKLVIKFADHPMQEFARQIRPEYYQVWDEDGTVVARSRRLASGNLERTAGSLAAPRYRSTNLPDGRPGRLVGVQFLPVVEGESLERRPEIEDDDPEEAVDQVDFTGRRRVTLVVAKETAEIERTLGRLAWTLFGVSTTAVAAMLTILSWIVKRSLRPLDDLAAQIAALDERGLTTRIHVPQSPQELAPVVARLNELLARLENAIQRERVLTANVAHELRTPLAGLRTALDVVLGRRRGAAAYRQVLEDCQAICHDTQGLVDTLLSLARIDAGRAVVDRSFVDVAESVAKSWGAIAARARERSLNVRFDGPSGVLLSADASMLRVVLANLFDNAVEYADQGGSVECRWSLEQRGLSLEVANSGCGLDQDQTRKVFDRFWRADAARAATGLHAGLGLSLCKRIIEILGGSIDATVRNGSFMVKIEFDAEFVENVAIADGSDPAADGDPVDGFDRNDMRHEFVKPLGLDRCSAVGVIVAEGSEQRFTRQ